MFYRNLSIIMDTEKLRGLKSRMEMGLLYISYIISTTIALLVSLRLLGFKNTGFLGIAFGVINGSNDFFIKEVLHPANLFGGSHILISIILVTILCYWWLRLKLLGAIFVPCLAYILTALSEVMTLTFIISLFDKSFIEGALNNIYTQVKLGALAQLPLIIAFLLLQFKFKNFSIYNFTKNIR